MRQIKFKYIAVKPKIIFSEIFTLRDIELGKAQIWCEENMVYKDSLYKLQWPGLTDKNGKEIYEGDIVELIPTEEHKTNSHMTGIRFVEYIDSLASFFYNGFVPMSWGGFESVEIIGNIHQNQELLK